MAYLDPPYVWASRKSGRYDHEMTDADHQELVAILMQYKGAVILSGYPNALYAPLEAAGWKRDDFTRQCSLVGKTSGTRNRGHDATRTECVWRNPECLKRPVLTR